MPIASGMDTSAEERLACLVEAVQLVAAASEVQLAVLPDGVCKPDEIALTFDDCFLLVPDLVASGLVSAQAQGCLAGIDALFSRLTDIGPAMWSEATVRQRPEWSELRARAAEALAA